MKNLVFVIFLLGFEIGFSQEALKVEKVTITVNDLDVSVPFYENVLGFEKVDEKKLQGQILKRLTGIEDEDLSLKIVTLKLGDEIIELQEFLNEKIVNQIPIDSKSNDLWFQHIAIVVRNMDEAYQKLRDFGITHVSTTPQTLPEYITAAAGIKAFYFQDPDRHVLEIIYFPKGKGDPKWQGETDQLFLGIDHTAIGIDKTERSKPFYEDLIGLKIMGQSENYGPEQEHLNQVFGARLLISGLKAKSGFGVEFLDYIAPPNGMPYPVSSRPTDIWHWHTTISIKNVESIYQKCLDENRPLISEGLVTIDNKKQFMLRDVDGHAILLYEK